MKTFALIAALMAATPAYADQPARDVRGHSAWGTEHVDNKGPGGSNNCAGGGCSQRGGTVHDDGKTNPPPGHQSLLDIEHAFDVAYMCTTTCYGNTCYTNCY